MQRDLRSVESALSAYKAHCGKVPKQTVVFSAAASARDDCGGADLGDLLLPQTMDGKSAGPFLATPPTVPGACKGSYRYSGDGGAFKLSYEPAVDDLPKSGCSMTFRVPLLWELLLSG